MRPAAASIFGLMLLTLGGAWSASGSRSAAFHCGEEGQLYGSTHVARRDGTGLHRLTY